MFSSKLSCILRVSGGIVRLMGTCKVSELAPKTVIPALMNYNSSNSVFQQPLYKQKTSILDLPLPMNSIISDAPKFILPFEDKVKTDIIDDPTQVIEQKAARLIVIRRRKMKRHKLKKLRIKMKFLWARVRQRREMKKEKAFQAELMGQINEAQKFDAAMYAKEKIDKANAVLLPKLWKGKRLPEFIIKQLVAEKQRKTALNKENLERRKKMDLQVSNYKF